MHRCSLKLCAVMLAPLPAPEGPAELEGETPPGVGVSCHVPGPWLSSGSWGGALLLLGRVPYLISQGPRLMDRRAWSLSHQLPGCPILPPSRRGWAWRWIVGTWPSLLVPVLIPVLAVGPQGSGSQDMAI